MLHTLYMLLTFASAAHASATHGFGGSSWSDLVLHEVDEGKARLQHLQSNLQHDLNNGTRVTVAEDVGILYLSYLAVFGGILCLVCGALCVCRAMAQRVRRKFGVRLRDEDTQQIEAGAEVNAYLDDPFHVPLGQPSERVVPGLQHLEGCVSPDTPPCSPFGTPPDIKKPTPPSPPPQLLDEMGSPARSPERPPASAGSGTRAASAASVGAAVAAAATAAAAAIAAKEDKRAKEAKLHAFLARQEARQKRNEEAVQEAEGAARPRRKYPSLD